MPQQLVRLVLSPVREHWLKAAYRRHALKTVVTAPSYSASPWRSG